MPFGGTTQPQISMITIATAIVFAAFYMLYYTSKRVLLVYNFGFENWMHQNTKPTKIIAIVLLAIAYFLCINTQGIGAGSLFYVIVIMTIGSLIVILKPLKIINSNNILLLFVLIECIEVFYS